MKKILFACVPADGHFNPMTRLAVYLKGVGYDVRWYTGELYEQKLKRMNIPYFPFKKALQLKVELLDEIFPERKKLRGPAHIKFDIKHLFIDRYGEYYEDIAQIYESFPFDLFVCDFAFPGAIIKNKLNVPTIAIGVAPLAASSKDLPPYGLGMKPANSFSGRAKQLAMRFMANQFIFKDSLKEYNKLLAALGLPEEKDYIFDLTAKGADIYLQNGVPGIDYPRTDMPPKVKYVGHMELWTDPDKHSVSGKNWSEIFKKDQRTLLVSNGTVERDNHKLIIPTLEAFKDSAYTIVVATAYNDTEALRKQYPQKNIHIEDFIPYKEIMPFTDVFITNGGYGSVMLSIEHGVPMVAAGINEGKNEICARVDYCGLGIDLRKENPKPAEIKKSVEKVLSTPFYTENIARVKKELSSYDTLALCEKYVTELLSKVKRYNSNSEKFGNMSLEV